MKPVVYAGIILLFISVVLVCGCTSTVQSPGTTVTIPSLIGNWTGTWKDYAEGVGYENGAGYSMTASVTGQQDRIFWGTLYFTDPKGITSNETFAGVIGPDGKTLKVVEQDGGYSSGTYTAPDQVELIYTYSGENYNVAIDTLKKA